MKEAYSHRQKRKRCGAPSSSFVCQEAAMWISHFGWEKRSTTFSLTFLTLPAAHRAVQRCCPHLESHPHLRPHHPPLRPHFPRRKRMGSQWNVRQIHPPPQKHLQGTEIWKRETCRSFSCPYCKAALQSSIAKRVMTGRAEISYLGGTCRRIINRCRRAFLLMNKYIFPPLSSLAGFFQDTC